MPHEPIKSFYSVPEGGPPGETRQVIAYVLNVISVLDEIPICKFLSLMNFCCGKSSRRPFAAMLLHRSHVRIKLIFTDARRSSCRALLLGSRGTLAVGRC